MHRLAMHVATHVRDKFNRQTDAGAEFAEVGRRTATRVNVRRGLEDAKDKCTVRGVRQPRESVTVTKEHFLFVFF